VEFRVLGPVEVLAGGSRLDAGHARQRAVLAVLVLELGRVVPAEVLVDRVWGEDPPRSVRGALYGYASRLRALTAEGGEPPAVLARRAGGYVLEAAPEQVDVQVFRRLAAEAAAVSDHERAVGLLRRAAGLWQGSALGGVTSAWLDGVREGLEQERRAAVLDLFDVGLRLGRHAALVGELSEAVAGRPADERLVGLLMLALYRSGRAAEALRWFERARRGLAEELGADPGPELRRLHEQVLRADPALDWQAPASTTAGLAVGAGASGGADSGAAESGAGESGAGKSGAAGSGAAGSRLVPRELPADVAAFTGRAAEIAELDRLLATSAVDGTAAVVISAVSGTAGVGKTALAVRWAHQAAHLFPDGQLYVNLRGYDPGQPVSASDALAALLRSLGVTGEDIPPGEDSRAARYRSLLAGRRMLVVLDNASDATQVRPLLPGSPGCRVVVTSRDALAGLVARDGARRLDLDLLPERDATALLRAVVGARVDEEPAAARLLAAQCARLPLALRVAAELAVARPGLTLAELVSDLSDEQQRLERLGAGGDPHTAVRAVLSWSCRHLDEATVAGFALLGLHPGPDLEPYAVAALTGTTLADARRLLETLTRAHLIQSSPAGPGRYALHDLLRAYARDLAAAQGEPVQRAAVSRLLDHYLQTAAAAMDTLHPSERGARPDVPPPAAPVPPVTEPDTARAWLDDQLACLIAAAAPGWPGYAVHLGRVLYRYLLAHAYLAEVLTLYARALSGARSIGDRDAELQILVSLGAIEASRDRGEEASGYLAEALALAEETGNRTAQARALGNLGLVNRSLSRYQEAISHLEEALALCREIGDRVSQARLLEHLGEISLQQDRFPQAIGYLREALAAWREIGDPEGESGSLTDLGYCETALGHHQEAIAYFNQGLRLAREVGHRLTEAYALAGLGKVSSGLGRHDQAVSLLQAAVEICREADDRRFGLAEVLNHLGEALLAGGQAGQASEQYLAALGVADEIGELLEQARALDGLAYCYRAAGDHGRARGHWQQALAHFTAIGCGRADRVRAELEALAGPDGPVTQLAVSTG
jgi:DNA-binding SARP family transcriptional activator/tetratricopeptide (TPR) repeat protein